MFDTPNPEARRWPFEERYASLLRILSHSLPFVSYISIQATKNAFTIEYVIAMRKLCFDKPELIATMQQVLDDGGEGIILRNPNSAYVGGRSQDLIKMKVNYHFLLHITKSSFRQREAMKKH